MKNPLSCNCPNFSLPLILRKPAQATANIAGSKNYPDIAGTVQFYQTSKGVIVFSEIKGLPRNNLPCQEQIFGFHIHSGSSCSGNANDPFANALSHYDLNNCAHPYHDGDMPPLFGNNGLAISAFLTNRFSVEAIIGRTVVIHIHSDDFETQPSGNSGTKIACGVIHRTTGFCQ